MAGHNQTKICNTNPAMMADILAHKITYTQIGEKVNRDRATVWRWLANPNLDATRRALLAKAIEDLKGEVE